MNKRRRRRVEAPKGPFGQVVVEGKRQRRRFWDTRVWCMVTMKKPLEEEERGDSGSEERGPGPP